MATAHQRMKNKMVVKNAVKLKKTRKIRLTHPVSREKKELIPQKPLVKKRKQLKRNDDETLETMKEIREKFSHRKNHQIDVEDRFAASLAYEVYPKKKSLWLSRRYQMLYINFR